jgi:cyclohexanone monooxygenase
VVSIVQSGFSVNFPHMLDEQAKHVAYLVAHARDNGLTRIETSKQAEDEWVRTIIDLSQMNLKFLEACTPGYYNNEGNPAARSARDGAYGAGSPAFIRLLEEWRARGDLAGLEVA